MALAMCQLVSKVQSEGQAPYLDYIRHAPSASVPLQNKVDYPYS